MVIASLNASSARPYSHLAANYDATVGLPFYKRTRRIFERLIRLYGIHFRTAADIGCGTGLFARYLNRVWRVPVIGVDISPEMLRVAGHHCRGLKVAFIRQDIRHLKLPHRVDLITCNFDTLNHLVGDGDLMRAFQHISQSLNPGGHFIFDMVLHCRPLGRTNEYIREFRNGWRTVTQHVRWQPWRRLLSIVVSIRSPDRCDRIIEKHQERAYSMREIGDGLHAAGLIVRGVHDGATLAPATECLPRIVVVAMKKGR